MKVIIDTDKQTIKIKGDIDIMELSNFIEWHGFGDYVMIDDDPDDGLDTRL